jgi:hypothetical protein
MYIEMWPILEHNYKVMAERSRLGRITHLEKTDKLKKVNAVSWAASPGENLKEILMAQKKNRDF